MENPESSPPSGVNTARAAVAVTARLPPEAWVGATLK